MAAAPATAEGATNSGVESRSEGPVLWKSYLYQLQQQAPTPKLIECIYDLGKRPDQYGREFHGLISREDAERQVAVNEGAYLVRESQRAPGSYTLTMRFDNDSKHYKLFYDGRHFIADKHFDSIYDLVADGLITMYIEKHASDYIERMAQESLYEESPYMTLHLHQQKLKQRQQQRARKRRRKHHHPVKQQPQVPQQKQAQDNADQGVLAGAVGERHSLGRAAGEAMKPADDIDGAAGTNVDAATSQQPSIQPVRVAPPPPRRHHPQSQTTAGNSCPTANVPEIPPSVNKPNIPTATAAAGDASPNVMQSNSPEIPPRVTQGNASTLGAGESNSSVDGASPRVTQSNSPSVPPRATQTNSPADISPRATQSPEVPPRVRAPSGEGVSSPTNDANINHEESPVADSTMPIRGAPGGTGGQTLDRPVSMVSSDGQLEDGADDELELAMEDTSLYEKPHIFKMQTFRGMNWCFFCGNFLWGLVQQGVKCTDCGFVAHKKCSEQLPNDCLPDLKYVKRMFGVDLTTLVKAYNTPIPAVVERCVSEVEARGLTEEGIYRVPGFSDDIEFIKAMFDRDADKVNISRQRVEDINTICGVLKLYLRLLPIPVIPYDVYNEFIEFAQLSAGPSGQADVGQQQQVETMRACVRNLPPAHYRLLKYILNHLLKVVDHSDATKMGFDNISMVFGPTLLCSANPDPMARLISNRFEGKVVDILLRNYVRIFTK